MNIEMENVTSNVKRPTRYDVAVIEAASHKVAKQVQEWLHQKCNINDPVELEEIRLSLLDILNYNKDGYEMAKDMEDQGYDSDSALVEIMDSANWVISAEYDKMVEKWMSENSVKPQLKLGDIVKITEKNDRFKKDVYEGEIVSIDEKKGEYHVFIESLGHVRKGIGTHSRIFSFEWVENQNLFG